MDHHFNLVLVSGVLPRDPRLDTAAGKSVCRFTLEQRQGAYVTFIPVEAYGKLIDACAPLTAGQYLGVEGRLKWSSYTTRSGEKRSGLVVLARALKALVPPVPAVRAAVANN